VAAQLLATVEGSWRRLAARPSAELLRIDGVGPAKAARLVAAFEIGARLAAEARPHALRIRDPADVARLIGPRLRDLSVEEFHLLALDSQSQVLRDVLVTRGLLNSSLVHPREVFRAAIVEAAAGIIVVHNHPSGDPTPSAEDRAVTRQLVEAGRLLDLPVYDHIIVAGDRFTSFASEGWL
jgi:DNA repair protein RadC